MQKVESRSRGVHLWYAMSHQPKMSEDFYASRAHISKRRRQRTMIKDEQRFAMHA